MSQLRLLCALFIVALPFNGANGQDYYKGRTTVKGIKSEYTVIYENHEDGNVIISNKANNGRLFKGFPYLLDTKEIIFYTENIEFDQNTLKKILKAVFTKKELDKFGRDGCEIFLDMEINPKTGKAIELSKINLAGLAFRSIPITRIERLEKIIKKRLPIIIPTKYLTANYLRETVHISFHDGQIIVW